MISSRSISLAGFACALAFSFAAVAATPASPCPAGEDVRNKGTRSQFCAPRGNPPRCGTGRQMRRGATGANECYAPPPCPGREIVQNKGTRSQFCAPSGNPPVCAPGRAIRRGASGRNECYAATPCPGREIVQNKGTRSQFCAPFGRPPACSPGRIIRRGAAGRNECFKPAVAPIRCPTPETVMGAGTRTQFCAPKAGKCATGRSLQRNAAGQNACAKTVAATTGPAKCGQGEVEMNKGTRSAYCAPSRMTGRCAAGRRLAKGPNNVNVCVK